MTLRVGYLKRRQLILAGERHAVNDAGEALCGKSVEWVLDDAWAAGGVGSPCIDCVREAGFPAY